jgi:hypothetical protein
MLIEEGWIPKAPPRRLAWGEDGAEAGSPNWPMF